MQDDLNASAEDEISEFCAVPPPEVEGTTEEVAAKPKENFIMKLKLSADEKDR